MHNCIRLRGGKRLPQYWRRPQRVMVHYQRERALLEELGPFLSAGAIQSLAQEADRIQQVLTELERYSQTHR